MYELTIEPTGDVIEVEEGQTLLDAILRNGLHIPYQCGHGLCSTCKVTVLEGEYENGEASPFALMDFERDEGVALACCATPRSDMVIEAEMEIDEDARRIPVRDFSGTVERLVDLTPDIKGVFLRLSDEIDFQAGQYINLTIPTVDGPRAFSIATPESSKDLVELHIRKVPGGKGTTYVHEQLKEGDKLTFSGPFGRFFIKESRNMPILLIAGGSGLSSPRSMALDLLEKGYDQPIHLFHGARAVKDLYYADDFRRMEQEYANFSYTPALSQLDDGDDWNGETGFVHEALDRAFPDGFKGWTAYLCGPPPMIEASIRTLMKGRLFEKDIYTESFLTAADAETAAKSSKVFKRI